VSLSCAYSSYLPDAYEAPDCSMQAGMTVHLARIVTCDCIACLSEMYGGQSS
jgi:hypothetical protein